MARSKKIRTATEKHRSVWVIVVVGIVMIAGFILIHAFAKTPFVAIEPENGSTAKGAFIQSDTKASGGKSNRFVGADPDFKSAMTTESNSYFATKDSYGPVTPLSSKGYPKMTIAQVADKATTASTTCSLGTVDTKLDWNDGTCMPRDTAWTQQGITGVGSSGWANRSDIILVSSHNADDSQARLTVYNTTTKKQAYVYLVRPCANDPEGYCALGAPDNCTTTHAGGLAWYKQNLFVADSNCLIVFDINNLYQVPNGHIMLPTTHFWQRGTTEMSYSGVGLDTTGSTPQLMIVESNGEGEGNTGCNKTHVARWSLDIATATLKLDSGSSTKATSDKVVSSPICVVQGVAYTAGVYILSTFTVGGGTDYDYRVRAVATAPPDAKFHMPYQNSEGIYLDTRSGRAWGVTELAASDGNVRVYSWSTASMLEYY